MSILAGKVYMRAPNGERRFVPPDRVKMLEERGAKVVPVRVRKTFPGGNVVERALPGDYGVKAPGGQWSKDNDVEVVESGPNMGTSLVASLGRNAALGASDVVQNAPMMAASMLMPGAAGAIPAAVRFGASMIGGTAGGLGAQAIRGQDLDPGSAATTATIGSAIGIPFELAANYLPRLAPKMASDVLRPTKRQQDVIEGVEGRQTGQKTTADYERAGREMLRPDLRLRPSKEAEARLEELNTQSGDAVNLILDAADAAGFRVMPTQLIRSPEILALKKQMKKEGASADDIKALNNYLKNFVRQRSTPGTAARQPQPTGVLNAQGQMGMTPFVPGQPARQKPFTANKLGRQALPGSEGEKIVWRREAAPINKAREAGTLTDRVQGVEARAADALAHAANRHLKGIGLTTADPENVGAQVDIPELYARQERRLPLQEMVHDFNTRPPLTAFERFGLLRGRMPISEAAEGGLSLSFSDPRYVLDLLSKGRGVTGIAAQDVTRRATEGR